MGLRLGMRRFLCPRCVPPAAGQGDPQAERGLDHQGHEGGGVSGQGVPPSVPRGLRGGNVRQLQGLREGRAGAGAVPSESLVQLFQAHAEGEGRVRRVEGTLLVVWKHQACAMRVGCADFFGGGVLLLRCRTRCKDWHVSLRGPKRTRKRLFFSSRPYHPPPPPSYDS